MLIVNPCQLAVGPIYQSQRPVSVGETGMIRGLQAGTLLGELQLPSLSCPDAIERCLPDGV